MTRVGKAMVVVEYYSNVSWGKRKKETEDALIPSIPEPESFSRECPKDWTRPIQEIYEVDPSTCQKCQGQRGIIALIEDEEAIEKILKHLGLWGVTARPPPKVEVSEVGSELSI